MSRRSSYDFEAAEATLDKGDGSRARPMPKPGTSAPSSAFFARRSGALSDLEKTIELEPDHFGALVGHVSCADAHGPVQGGGRILVTRGGNPSLDPGARIAAARSGRSRPAIKGKQQEL
jgi:hypothetical protein